MYKIYSVSAGKSPANMNSLNSMQLNYEHILNNKLALSVVYNEILVKERTLNKNKWIIFLHDDTIVNFNEGHLVDTLIENDECGLLGVAGSTVAKITTPCLWHLMNETPGVFPNPEIHSGCVSHGVEDNYQSTTFGPYPRRVILIDGVLMAVKIDGPDDSIWFDINIAKFHFYDIDFSLSMYINNKITRVVDLPIVHQSPGLHTFTGDWRDGNVKFMNKWNKLL
jgi:hypothetical protein